MVDRMGRRLFSLLLCLCMILGMTDWTSLSVRAEGPINITGDESLTIELTGEPAGGYVYTGSRIEPPVAVYYGQALLSVGVTVSYPDMDAGSYVEPGEYTIRVTGDDVSYTGDKDFKFRIGKIPLSEVAAQPIEDKDYDINGRDITVDPSEYILTYNGTALSYDTDFTFDKYFNNTSTGNASKVATVQLIALNNSRFTGTKRIEFNIIRRSLLADTITMEPIPKEKYDGNAKQVNPVVYDDNGNKLLEKGKHYMIINSAKPGPGMIDITLRGQGAYSGIDKTVQFLIEKDLDFPNILNPDITLEIPQSEDLTYTGSPVEPNVVVTDIVEGKKKTLVKGQHYNVRYEGDTTTPGAMAKAIISGIDGSGYAVTPEREIEYTVDALDVDDAGDDLKIEFNEGKDCIYNGKAQEPSVKITYKDKYTISESDYIVLYGNNNKNAGVVTATIIFDGALKGQKEASFRILPKSLQDDDEAGSISVTFGNTYNPSLPPIYTGNQITSVVPVVVYTNADGDRIPLTLDDYTPFYTNNINASMNAQIEIRAKENGNYRNSTFASFEIGRKDISGANVTGIVNKPYTGDAIRQSITVNLESKNLSPTTDYTVEYVEGTDINVGEATVVIKGVGNYSGTITKTFQITKVSLDDGNISINNIMPQIYNGSQITPAMELKYNGRTLEEGKDYSLQYGENTAVGVNEGVVTITAIPDEPGKICNFSGSTEKYFTINPLNIEAQKNYIKWNGLPPDPHITYTGAERTVDDLVIQYDNGRDVPLTLTYPQDYDIEYDDNTDIGIATITIIARGNYTGTVTNTFKIYGNLGNTNNTTVKMKDGGEVYDVIETYTGEEITLDLDVKYLGTPLTEGEDYIVNYNGSNINAGTVNVTIEAVEDGFYYGSQSTSFTIAKKDISEEPYLAVDIPDQVFTGVDIIPPVMTVTYNGRVLVRGEDGEADTDFYIVKGENNVETGDEAKITIRGQGINFIGDYEETFTILPRDISDGSNGEEYINIENLEDVFYRGQDQVVQDEDNLVVKFNKPGEGFNDFELAKKDYEITYESNTRVGEAKIVITGVAGGNFKGTVKRTFKIKGDLADIDIDEIVPFVYSGLENKPTPQITYNCGIMQDVELELDKDYELSYNNEIIDASENSDGSVMYSVPTVTVKGINFYGGADRTKTFRILPKNLSADLDGIEFLGINEEGYEYTRFDIHPDFTMENHGNEMILSLDDGITGDYLITGYANVMNAALKDDENAPTVFIKGIGKNYYGETTLKFDIVPRKISADTVRVVGKNEDGSVIYKMDGTDKFDYVDPQTFLEYPVIEVYYIENKGQPNENEVLLTRGDLEGDTNEYTIGYTENNSPGKATLSITGHGNYDETYEKFFKVTASIENESYTDIASIPPQYYAGAVIGARPAVSVIVADELLSLENNDYTLTYFNNTALGSGDNEDTSLRPGVIIDATESEYYSGTRTIYFDIVIRDFDDKDYGMEGMEITGIDSNGYEYTGTPITFDFRIFNHQEELTLDVDYSFHFEQNTEASETEPCLVITGMGDKYKGTVKIPFKINRKTGLKIDSIIDQEFTGTEIMPVPVVRIGSGEPLRENIDYKIVEYKNNVDVANRTSAEPPRVIVEGMGNYQGQAEGAFSIIKRNIESNSDTDYFEIKVIGNDTYNGYELIPQLQVTRIIKGKSVPLTEAVDYQLKKGTQCVNAGDGNVLIEGIGNYGGSYLETFTIRPLDVRNTIADPTSETPIEIITFGPIDSVEFDGTDKTPDVTVIYYDALTQTTRELPSESNGIRNYTLEYTEHVNAGEATVTLIGEGNFINTKGTTFTITKKSLEDADIPAFEFLEAYLHTGEPIIPQPENAGTLKYMDYSLVYLTDYEIICTDNVKVGTASFQINGIGNFQGTLDGGSFLIKGDLANAAIQSITLQKYTGSEVRPTVNVSFYGDPLIEDTHFKVEYQENVKVGRATAIITGMEESNYFGTKSIDFVISDNFAAELSVSGIAGNYLFTGSAVKPIPAVVSVYGEVLKLGTDYQLSYKNNVNIGTAAVTINGIGLYKGNKDISYKIIPKSIARAGVNSISSQVYNGKKYTPQPVVKDGANTLVKDRDYSLVYVNNQKPGVATIIMNGKGNYNGSKSVYFNITVSQVTKFSYSATATNKMKLSWTKLAGVTGYEIYNSGNKLVSKIKKNTNTVTISNANPSKTYKYKIRAYVLKDGSITFGKFSSYITASSKPKAPTIKLKSTVSKKAAVSWKKLAGASGYEVYQSTKRNGKYSRVAITSKSGYTKTKLKSKKTYYYRVRAYKTVNKKKIYSAYSPIKSIKIK